MAGCIIVNKGSAHRESDESYEEVLAARLVASTASASLDPRRWTGERGQRASKEIGKSTCEGSLARVVALVRLSCGRLGVLCADTGLLQKCHVFRLGQTEGTSTFQKRMETEHLQSKTE